MLTSGSPIDVKMREHGARSIAVTTPDGSPLGFVEVNRIVAGRCCGGIRASAGVTARELQRIAEVMTLKCGFVGLAAGGAKGGVVMPEGLDAEARAERFAAFGRAVGPLMRSGIWSHGTDMGTTEADIARIRHAAGLGPDPGPPGAEVRRVAPDASSGRGAGLTVALATEAVLDSMGIPVHDARVAIQGAGAVGRAAIESLAAGGARIVAVSTVAGTIADDRGFDARTLLDGLARAGDSYTGGGEPAAAVLEAECDVLLTCAGSGAVADEAVARLRARAVICGANIPFAEGVEERLTQRGVVVVPDFVAGGGGVLGSTLASVAGVTPAELERIFRRWFRPRVSETIEAARTAGEPFASAARRQALAFIETCDEAYGETRPPTLLPDRLAAPAPAWSRALLSLEKRVRGRPRLARLVPGLHALAIGRAESVLSSGLAVGRDGTK